ncbi:hypothetical protein ANN_22611 [Periplaneta americana]|uniref:Uncharacterized protein n=1 Tax=Periplaneta americana TaxID=6978 RepID=A0ABQ8S9J1_PERAM|nr:hypothetical protein ANN_22611 [Periplaneta americana]
MAALCEGGNEPLEFYKSHLPFAEQVLNLNRRSQHATVSPYSQKEKKSTVAHNLQGSVIVIIDAITSVAVNDDIFSPAQLDDDDDDHDDDDDDDDDDDEDDDDDDDDGSSDFISTHFLCNLIRGGPLAWGLGEGLKTYHRKKQIVTKPQRSFGMGLILWHDDNNMGILLDASKEIGLEVNPKRTKYLIMSPNQNILRNGSIKIWKFIL